MYVPDQAHFFRNVQAGPIRANSIYFIELSVSDPPFPLTMMFFII